jgi:hypothetical protein
LKDGRFVEKRKPFVPVPRWREVGRISERCRAATRVDNLLAFSRHLSLFTRHCFDGLLAFSRHSSPVTIYYFFYALSLNLISYCEEGDFGPVEKA